MATLLNRARRAVRRRTSRLRRSLIDNAPSWARTHFGRPAAYLELILSDHGLFRLLYLNKHQLAKDAWRSAQPAPGDIRKMAAQGIRTIINLRGPRDCSSYALERAACEEHGIALVDYQLRSRAAPTIKEVTGALEILDKVEYPILFHCKSGADRAGLMSVLFMHFREGQPMQSAVKQLSLKYGHIRQADTGVLDYFFERYLEENAVRPVAFLEWMRRAYNPDEVKRSFQAKGWANRLVNSILHRE